MLVKKSFLVTIRIFFVVFSIVFIKDAFYKWDGYSYHMQFTEFLPDLSLAFILWTIIGVIFAFAFWLTSYGLSKILSILPNPLKSVNFEHIMGFFILIMFSIFILIIKRTFFNIPVRDLTGLNLSTIYIIGGIFLAALFWLIRKQFKKIPQILNARITPLVWFFLFLLVLAVPFSFLKMESGKQGISSKSVQVAFRDKKLPNIIMVVMDALTARDMSLYGYNRTTTPFISEWAKDAAVFNRTYSADNWTLPSTMSIMTGQRPWTHGRWHPAYMHTVKDYDQNLPTILKENGYAVYGFVQNSFAHPETLGIRNAFLAKDKAHTFALPLDWWFDKLKRKVKRQLVKEWIFEKNFIAEQIILKDSPDIDETRVPPDQVYNRFFNYISSHKERPFFAYIHLLPPHGPYLPLKPYKGMFGDADKFNSVRKLASGPEKEYGPERQKEVDILRKRYDEFILYSDQRFKSFISRLNQTIDITNTIIILSSDHGESFSHGFLGHTGPHLFEELVHIPLVIKAPGKIKAIVLDMPVEHIDIAPTILDLAGIPVPQWMEGRSLKALIKGKPFQPRPLFTMDFRTNRADKPISKGTIAVVDGDYKLIHYLEDNKTLLFNLKSDPDETRNIFFEKPEIAQRLKRLIDENLSKVNKKFIRLTALSKK